MARKAKTHWAGGFSRASNHRSTFSEQDPDTKVFRPITDEAKILEIGRAISPVNHVSSDDPPILIIHGDADYLVPIQQAQLIVDKLKKVGVESKLVVKNGAGHGWPNLLKDMTIIADWFDEHLKKKPNGH